MTGWGPRDPHADESCEQTGTTDGRVRKVQSKPLRLGLDSDVSHGMGSDRSLASRGAILLTLKVYTSGPLIN